MMAAAAALESRKAFIRNNWLAPMDTSHLAEHAGTAGTLFASVFLVSMTTMKTMVPLRAFGILLNLVLIATAIPTHNYLTIVVQSLVLVLNGYRLHQMLQLIRDVRQSVNSDLSIDWLKPFMTERNCKAGEVVYYKDERAGHGLHRQRPLPSRGIRHRIAGRRHRRRTRHAGAVEGSHADPGMHR